jgi:hypothetical protein
MLEQGMDAVAGEDDRTPRRYIGSAWRSRFLRAPKIALELAAREDFVQLGQLAEVRLGLKTGADDYFFLQRIRSEVQREATLLPQRGLVAVRGKDGWIGKLAQADLKPAVLNPHEFISGGSKRLVVQRETRWLYLHPSGKVRGGLADYIKLGEVSRLPEKALVKSNAAVDAWYRQVRSLVRSPWVLPYNSAYDYGAWDNSVGAVLNGRFVGVTPVDEVDSDALGGLLNSTFAAVGRLIEGVATGVEGAFDVGPPAVRKIRVPDIRRFSVQSIAAIGELLDEMRNADEMPALPTAEARVPKLRRRLDAAILKGLGATEGQSAALLENIYGSYARWRAHIEGVEDQAQKNRRDLSRSGRSRSVRPEEAIGRRIWEELKADSALFPGPLLLETEPCESVLLPPRAVIPDNHPLLEPGVIVGTGRRRIDLKSYSRVEYAEMLREIGVTGLMSIPVNSERADAIVRAFQGERTKLRTLALERASLHFASAKSAAEAVGVVERQWLSACRHTVTTSISEQD